MSEVPSIRLSDGHAIPQLGFGTWRLTSEVAERAVARALEVGDRHLGSRPRPADPA